MNKDLFNILKGKCKDMGLSEKALIELATAASEGLTDDSTEEEISQRADSLVPYAKAMQGEITRKTQKKSTDDSQSSKDGEKGGQNGGKFEIPEDFKKWQEGIEKQVTDLRTENQQLKAEKAKTKREQDISAEAKKLGIPDYLMKRLHIGDDEDVTKVLTEYKQDLVTNNLISADEAGIASSKEEASKETAKSLLEEIEVKPKG